MNKELDKLIEQVLVNSKNIKATLQERTMAGAQVDTKSTEESRVLKLPKFALSEKWGQPDSEDRKTISLFIK